MRQIVVLITAITILQSCAELQDIASRLPDASISNADIAMGLRQALDQGIEQQVTTLMQENGFYGNDAVKILLPEELQVVDRKLRQLGLGNLADEGLLLLNRAAEEAVADAKPIFVNAVKNITFRDARNILMGDDRAATSYLENVTEQKLYNKFQPTIKSNLEKVGAISTWNQIISTYNQVPFVEKVNPDLADYVTNEALDGVYFMIAQEEQQIRNNFAERSTNLLKRVFALQD